jgi:hypothetical protein
MRDTEFAICINKRENVISWHHYFAHLPFQFVINGENKTILILKNNRLSLDKANDKGVEQKGGLSFSRGVN